MTALFPPEHDTMPERQRDALERLCAMVAANRASFAVQDFAKRSQAARKGSQRRRK